VNVCTVHVLKRLTVGGLNLEEGKDNKALRSYRKIWYVCTPTGGQSNSVTAAREIETPIQSCMWVQISGPVLQLRGGGANLSGGCKRKAIKILHLIPPFHH